MGSDCKFHKQKKSFDGNVDMRSAPIMVFGGEIMLQMDVVVNHVFGKKTVNLPIKIKRREESLTM